MPPGQPARSGRGPRLSAVASDPVNPDSVQPGDQAMRPESIRDGDFSDELPADLDLTAVDAPITFPNNNRRRIPATMYLILGAGCIGAYLSIGHSSPLVNRGVMVAGVLLCVFAVYGFVAGRTLRVDEAEALSAAAASLGFPVGHASAQMTWRGLLSQPVWRLLCYSDENPPKSRAMVIVDGCTAEVLEHYSEDNPEDWALLSSGG